MVKIDGLYNTTICYCKTLEDSAKEQIKELCNQEAFENCNIRIMPDVHAGKGCTIGTTMTIKDKIVPNLVGVDIGCGMHTVSLGKIDIDFERLDEICHIIPSGKNAWKGRIERFDITNLKCYRNLNKTKHIARSLGTLGGGNHFIELDEAQDGTKYLVIHSGSRNLGKQVAEFYQSLAIDLNKGKEEYLKKRVEIIETYKSEGRKSEIQQALSDLKWEVRDMTIPPELCFLYGDYAKDYLFDADICQKFAKRNRELMAEKIVEYMDWTVQDSFTTIHNYIDIDSMILRKGSVSAKKGERLLIPINMRDGALICVGKGNADWNFSAPHGAGRLMSRSVANETLSLDEFQKEMKGIYSTSICESTLDESPMAYKSASEIIEQISPTAEIIEIIKPIFNFKAN